MMNSGCRTSVCQNERNQCGNPCGTQNDENDRGFQRWKMSMGKTRSRATADTQRDERAQICEEICCDGKSQTERREEKLVAQEHNVEAEAGTGERHCGVTRNINQHTRTETQWSGEAVTKKDIVCEKIFFSGAGGKPFKDLGDIDSEATIQTTWSPEGFQLTRTIKKVENFKTNCILDTNCDECDTNKQDVCPVTTPSPKCLQSPVCDAVDLKPFKPFCRHPPDFEALASTPTSSFPLGFGGGTYALTGMNQVRRAHTLSASDPRQSQPSSDRQRPTSYGVQSSYADHPRGPFHPVLLSRLLNLSRTCLK